MLGAWRRSCDRERWPGRRRGAGAGSVDRESRCARTLLLARREHATGSVRCCLDALCVSPRVAVTGPAAALSCSVKQGLLPEIICKSSRRTTLF